MLEQSGLGEVLLEDRIPFVDINHQKGFSIRNAGRCTNMKTLTLPLALQQADLIVSIAKMKTHHWAGVTLSLKNCFGCVPGRVYGWPKNFLHLHGIENSILDLNATVRPHFTIVDAITAMEGDGPIMGKPRQTGFLAMGRDLVAVDATCARIIGFDPTKIPYLARAGEFLGNLDAARIDQRGERLTRYETRFDVLPNFRELQLAGGA